MSRFFTIAFVAAGFAVSAPVAQAQVGVGATVGLLDYYGGSSFGVGGHVEAPLEALDENMTVVGELLVYLEDHSPLQISGDVRYDFRLEDKAFTPFASAGLSYIRADGLDDTAITAGGGIKFDQGSSYPTVGLRLHLIGDAADFFVFGSFTFGLDG